MCQLWKKIALELTHIWFVSVKFFVRQMPPKDKGNRSIGTGAVEWYNKELRIFTEQEQELTISPKIIGAESLQESTHSFAGPSGESPPERKLKGMNKLVHHQGFIRDAWWRPKLRCNAWILLKGSRYSWIYETVWGLKYNWTRNFFFYSVKTSRFPWNYAHMRRGFKFSLLYPWRVN